MIYARPGDSFESFLTDAPTGLVGTLTFRLIDPPAGTVEIAETTSGITEPVTGIYTKTAAAPDDQGTYLIVWKNGSTEIGEELVVTADIPTGATPSDFNLTTLEAVRSQLQKQATDTDQDDVIEQLIASASWAITQRYGKFRPVEASATKKFDWDGGHRLNLFPYYLRNATAITLDTNETSTTSLSSAVSVNDYALRPKSPLDDVYKWVRLPNHQVQVGLEREVSITGDWGYATVPVDVEQACIVTVVEWMRRGVQAFGTGGFASEDEPGLAPAGLPMAAKRLLMPYDRNGQG